MKYTFVKRPGILCHFKSLKYSAGRPAKCTKNQIFTYQILSIITY